MPLALQLEPTAYSSLLIVAGAVLADPGPMPARLVRGCIALAFTACVLAVACSHCLADTVKGGELSYNHAAGVATGANCVQLATDAGRDGPGRP